MFVVILFGMIAAWYLVPKFLETPAYKVVEKARNIEVRYYESMLLQSVKVSGNQYKSLRQGFRPLVNYIGAKGREGEKISMTAPVMQSLGNTNNEWIVSFSMPSKYSKKTLPEPNNKQVYSEQLKPIMAAVIRFSGKTDRSGSLIKEKEKTLLNWLKNRDFKIVSKPKYLFYNDPSTPGFLRRNEVMVIISD
ncbi:heme-binding protein [Rhodobacteraceae bacterium]|nr:heme-binding protein [Paracoccaceae bacterium]